MSTPRQLRNKFRKAERLCSHSALNKLYADGQPFLAYPLRCVYRTVESAVEPLCIMISAPKRNHKTAVVRNLLKRRIREAYRLNRALLKERLPAEVSLEFSITYISKEILDYQTIENAVKKILTELGNRHSVTAH